MRSRARRPSPLAIALACAVAAEVFNLLLDLYTWTGTGNHTLAAFGVVLGSAAAFDITHVVASFVFGLAFGATLLRMLMRVRARMEVSWQRAQRAGAARWPRSAPASPPRSAGARGAAAALAGARAARRRAQPSGRAPTSQRAQNADGGFGAAPGQSSSELYTAWAAIGLAAAGAAPPRRSRATAIRSLDSLRGEAATLQGAGDLERTILALHACGASAHRCPAATPSRACSLSRRADGSFEQLANLTSFGDPRAARRRACRRAATRSAERPAGWPPSRTATAASASPPAAGSKPATSTTPAAAIQALAAAGVHGAVR